MPDEAVEDEDECQWWGERGSSAVEVLLLSLCILTLGCKDWVVPSLVFECP